MRPEVAQLSILLFVPALVVILSYRAWQRERAGAWPPPLSFTVSILAVVALLFAIWRASIAL